MNEPILSRSIDNNNGSISLITDQIYNKAINSHFHIKAENNNFYIFSPNWKELAESPAEELENLVAQSIGLDPAYAVYKWARDYAIPVLKNKGEDEKCKRLKEFIRRVDVAIKNLVPYGDLKPIFADDSDKPPKFNRLEFMIFAARLQWETPDEFRPLKEDDTQSNQSNELKALSKERDTLLKLILGMAIDAYDYVPGKPRNTASGNNSNGISSALQRCGLSVDQKTVAKYLNAATQQHPTAKPRER